MPGCTRAERTASALSPGAEGASGFAGSEGCRVKGSLCSDLSNGCQGALIRSLGAAGTKQRLPPGAREKAAIYGDF